MSEHDSFEERLRAVADQISQSVRRMSEVDLEELADRYGIDAERARGFADAAGQWLSDHMSTIDPLFGSPAQDQGRSAPEEFSADFDPPPAAAATSRRATRTGPHPLDLPDGRQGLALSALDSGRMTVQPGSDQLAGTGTERPSFDTADLVSELRARDWITATGALTLTGRHALDRWCRTAEDPGPPTPSPAPPAA